MEENDIIDDDAIQPQQPPPVDPEYVEYINGLNELGVYMAISAMGSLSNQMIHDLKTKPKLRESQEGVMDIARASVIIHVQLPIAINRTAHFGVKPYDDPNDKHPGADYHRWFKWWHDYITKLSPVEWATLENKINRGEPHEEWRPEGTYRPEFFDGTVPGSWICSLCTKKEILDAIKKSRPDLLDTAKSLVNFCRDGKDELRSYSNPTKDNFGYCLLRDSRAIAAISLAV